MYYRIVDIFNWSSPTFTSSSGDIDSASKPSVKRFLVPDLPGSSPLIPHFFPPSHPFGRPQPSAHSTDVTVCHKFPARQHRRLPPIREVLEALQGNYKDTPDLDCFVCGPLGHHKIGDCKIFVGEWVVHQRASLLARHCRCFCCWEQTFLMQTHTLVRTADSSTAGVSNARSSTTTPYSTGEDAASLSPFVADGLTRNSPAKRVGHANPFCWVDREAREGPRWRKTPAPQPYD